MKKTVLVVLIVIAYAHNSLCMENKIIKLSPYNPVHLLQNEGAYLKQLKAVEDSGAYCRDFCIAQKTLKKFLYTDVGCLAHELPKMYRANRQQLQELFGIETYDNAVQIAEIAINSKRYLNCLKSCSDAPTGFEMAKSLKKLMAMDKAQATGACVRTHFPKLNGKTLMHYAASRWALKEVLEMFLTFAQPDLLDEYGRSPLFYALMNEDDNNTKILLKHKASVRLQDCNGSTPLHYAASIGQKFFIKKLCNKGANPNQEDDWGNTPVHVLLEGCASNEAIQFFLKYPLLDFNKRNKMGQSYLEIGPIYASFVQHALNKRLFECFPGHFAEYCGWDRYENECEHVAELISAGADVNAWSENQKSYTYGCTPLYEAISTGCKECVKLLIQKADVHCDKPNKKRNHSYIDCALDGEFYEAVEWLVGAGVDVDKKDHNGHTRLFCAAFRGDIGAVKVLLKCRALIEVQMLEKIGSLGAERADIFELLRNEYNKQNKGDTL